MKISINTIKKYTDIVLPLDELSNRIATQIGAIESIVDLGKKYSGIIIGEVLEKKEHPNADRLSVYLINIGERIVKVVAGDKTLKTGDKVAYFPPGTSIPFNPNPEKHGNIVEEINLKGIESEGMMASEKELDLGNDHTKIMRLKKECISGDNFSEAYSLNDLVYEIENKALANRGDCFGIIGLAREIAAIQGLKFVSPTWLTNPETNSPLSLKKEELPLEIENKAGDNCSRYVAITIKDIEIQESPSWMKLELIKSGIRPINNVVDITNYLMILTGQPLHAFDYDKIKERDEQKFNYAKIVIRPSKEGESVTTLDGKTVELPEGVTIICDSTHPIGIAGIMGGASTEIDQNTKNIVIECASFNRYDIRRSSMKLGLFTEAATRFTKALDSHMCIPVIYEAVRLLKDFANGKEASVIKDIYESISEPVSFNIDLAKVNKKLGTEFSIEEINEILKMIEYPTEILQDKTLKVSIPTYRKDIAIPEDIYEDIARIFGYNNIKITLPNRAVKPANRNTDLDFKDYIRNILKLLGSHEILTYNFVGKDLFEKALVDYKSAYHITNPLSPELEYMRLSLLPSILDKVSSNCKSYNDFILYEINKGHSTEELNNERLPIERNYLGISIYNFEEKVIFYDLKLYIDKLLEHLNVKECEYKPLKKINDIQLPQWIKRNITMLDVNRSAIILAKKQVIGIIGELSNTVSTNFELAGSTAVAEFDIQILNKAVSAIPTYLEPSKYPIVIKDLCIKTDCKITYASLYSTVKKGIEHQNNSFEIEPLDIYIDNKEIEKKKTTFRIKLRSEIQTLTSKEINEILIHLATIIKKDLSGEIV